MSDSARRPSIDSAERMRDDDARMDDLLLTGLDHYFAGGYQQAINVWTRLLFLDRGQARARAYIERARSALAEQQRESEALLHDGVAAFDRGERDLARRLVTSSLEHGGPQEVALPMLARLNRLETGENPPGGTRPASRPSVSTRAPRVRATATSSRRTWPIAVGLVAMATVAGAAGAVALLTRQDLGLPGWRRGESAVALSTQSADERWPLARPGEVALNRARRLFASGHASDALRVLNAIRPTDPQYTAGDRLRAEIQRELLSRVPTLTDPVARQTGGAGLSPSGLGR